MTDYLTDAHRELLEQHGLLTDSGGLMPADHVAAIIELLVHAPAAIHASENLSPAEVKLMKQLELFTDEGVLVPAKKIAQHIDSLLRVDDEQRYIEANRENKDSIEVSMNAKGDYAWKIKKYFGADMDRIGAAGMVDDIDKDLRHKFLTPRRSDTRPTNPPAAQKQAQGCDIGIDIKEAPK